MRDSLFEKSYAKINLFLKIIDKRNDGFHNIRSGVTLINLYDEVIAEKNSSFSVEYFGKFAPINKKFDDCVVEKIFSNFNLKKPNYKFKIKKNIPVQSGLGSASSNIATVLRILQKLKLITKNKKYNFATLGADVPIFINRQDCLVRGIGDKIISQLYPKYFFLLIKPEFNCSTKLMYSKITNDHIDYKINNDLNEINRFDVGNDFEKIIFKEHKDIINIFNFLKNIEGVIFSRVTGSGSCFYATFNNIDSAINAKKIFYKKYPNLWTFIAENNLSYLK